MCVHDFGFLYSLVWHYNRKTQEIKLTVLIEIIKYFVIEINCTDDLEFMCMKPLLLNKSSLDAGWLAAIQYKIFCLPASYPKKEKRLKYKNYNCICCFAWV